MYPLMQGNIDYVIQAVYNDYLVYLVFTMFNCWSIDVLMIN